MITRNFRLAYKMDQNSTGIITRIGEELTGPRMSKSSGMVSQGLRDKR